jgi:PIN domain nuclease of toxin-antitoxin system
MWPWGPASAVSTQPSHPSRARQSLTKLPLFLGGAAAQCQGRIRLPINLAEWLAQATAPLREAPFTHEIVLAAQQLPLPHPDPADLFLAASAQVMDLTLVTSDDNLLGLGTIRTLKN